MPLAPAGKGCQAVAATALPCIVSDVASRECPVGEQATTEEPVVPGAAGEAGETQGARGAVVVELVTAPNGAKGGGGEGGATPRCVQDACVRETGVAPTLTVEAMV